MTPPETVSGRLDARGVLRITLDRPERRNAFDGEMIARLTSAFDLASADRDVRVVVLAGNGPIFCAGGDVGWMKANGELDRDARIERASAVSGLFEAVEACAVPTIAAVQGAALGGGVGLIAACDFAIAEAGATLGTSEATLGIVPACLAPFLLAKVGASQARRLFLSGARIGADEALRIGLIHEVVAAGASLASAVDALVGRLLTVSPEAQRGAKALIRRLSRGADDGLATRRETIRILAESWASADGQEGMAAFLEKRPARWSGAG